MPLTEYVRIIRRRGWIVVVAALLTALSALVFSLVQTPMYRSTVYIGVSPARPDLGLTQSAKSLLRLYVFWMNSRTNAQRVISELELDRTPESLLSDVTIASDDSRFVIQIDVENEDGELANRIALKWAELFVQWRKDENATARREDQVNAFVPDAPRYELFRPKKSVNTLAGGILGVLLGAIAVFVLEYIESGVIRSAPDVERALGMSVLGTIPPIEKGGRHAAR